MRSTLCAGSYTLRAIFGPWNPTGPNRYSLKGWILGPSPFFMPLFTLVPRRWHSPKLATDV
jgi:hypothetical protein